MTIQDVFMVWQDVGLFLYAIFKAFLPLPSLEVVLVPLCIANPDKWILYSIEGAVGTFIGGAIGYVIAYRLGRKAFVHIASDADIEKGEELMNRYGLLAVFIGGVTPIPDFLLAYLAGFTRMRFTSFALCDAVARLLRSLLVTFCLKQMGTILDVDRFGTVFSFGIMAILLLRWGFQKYQIRAKTSKK